MPLTGQAKTDYQREYMRRRRSNTILDETDKRSNKTPESVRPITPGIVRPKGISDNQWAYIQSKQVSIFKRKS